MANDSDNAVKILISFGLDPSKAREAVAQIDELKDSTKEGTKATDEFNDSQEKAGKTVSSGAEEVKHLHINHRALGMALRDVNPELANLAHLLRFASGPGAALTVGVLAASVGYGIAKKALADYNIELDKMGASNALPAFEGVKTLHTSWDDAKRSMGEYMAAVAAAGKADSIDKQIEAEKRLTEFKLQNIELVAKAQMKAEELRLRTMGETAMADNLRNQYASVFASIEKAAEIKTGKEGELPHEFETRNAPGVQMELEAKVREATEAARKAKVALENANSELENLRGKPGEKTEAQKALDEAQRRMDIRNRVGSGAFTPADFLAATEQDLGYQAAGRGGSDKPYGQNEKEDLEAAEKRVADERLRTKQIEGKLEGLNQAVAAAEIVKSNAEAEGKKNSERVATIPGLITTEMRAKIIEEGVTAEDAVMRTGKHNEAQDAAINRMKELADTYGVNLNAIINVLNANHKISSTQQDDIESIKTQFSALAVRVAANAGRGPQAYPTVPWVGNFTTRTRTAPMSSR